MKKMRPGQLEKFGPQPNGNSTTKLDTKQKPSHRDWTYSVVIGSKAMAGLHVGKARDAKT